MELPEKLSKNINTYTSPLQIVVKDGSQASAFFLSSSGDFHVPQGLRAIVLKGGENYHFLKAFYVPGIVFYFQYTVNFKNKNSITIWVQICNLKSFSIL